VVGSGGYVERGTIKVAGCVEGDVVACVGYGNGEVIFKK